MTCCEVCGAKNLELRRGRCFSCYSQWIQSRPIGLGASCWFCGDKRRDYLKHLEVLATWAVTCFNCAGRLMALDPMPGSIPAMRRALTRQRRAHERRAKNTDSWLFPYERRLIMRRLGDDEEPKFDDAEIHILEDDMVLEVTEIAREIESLEKEWDVGFEAREVTMIRPAPQRL